MQNFASLRMFRARAQWITIFFFWLAQQTVLRILYQQIYVRFMNFAGKRIFFWYSMLSAVSCCSSIFRQFTKITFLYSILINHFFLHKRKQKTSSNCRRLPKIIQNRFSPVCVRGIKLFLFLSFFVEGQKDGSCQKDFYLFDVNVKMISIHSRRWWCSSYCNQ